MQLRAITCHRAFVVTALVAWVFATRLWLIAAGGSIVPFMDQWGAEAIGLYRPWLDGTLRWSDLFAAHNEHRIVLTRVANLALFEAAGGWNPWHQLLLNAVLHAATAGALAGLFWSALGRRSRAALIGVLAVVFASPCGWQNALWGFQSQVYFANVLTVAAVAGLIGTPPYRLTWWGGLAAAVLALFSNAGGLLASVAVLTVIVARPVCRILCSGTEPTTLRTDPSSTYDTRQTRPSRFTRTGLLVILLVGTIVALGLILRVEATHHSYLQAKSVGQFFSVFARSLAWPHVNQPLVAIVTQLPLIIVVIDHVRRRTSMGSALRAAIALALFAVLQAAAIAYSRGAGLPDARPLSRYQDPLLLGVAAQAFAVLWLAERTLRPGRMVAVAWLATLCIGFISLTEINLTQNLPYKRAHDTASLANIRDYAETGDAAILERNFGLPQPPEDSAVMRSVLDDPSIRRILPAGLTVSKVACIDRPPRIVLLGPWLSLVGGVTLVVSTILLVLKFRPVSSD